MNERVVQRQTRFQGRRLRLEILEVERCDGGTASREVVAHPDSVCAAVLTSERRWVLVRQFRVAAEQALLEVAGGNLDPGENPEQAILRELREEIGLISGRLRRLTELWPNPGFCSQRITCFLIDEAQLGPPSPEIGEVLDIHEVDSQEGVAMALDGRIADGASVATMLSAARLLGI